MSSLLIGSIINSGLLALICVVLGICGYRSDSILLYLFSQPCYPCSRIWNGAQNTLRRIFGKVRKPRKFSKKRKVRRAGNGKQVFGDRVSWQGWLVQDRIRRLSRGQGYAGCMDDEMVDSCKHWGIVNVIKGVKQITDDYQVG